MKCHSLEQHSSDCYIRYFCEWSHVSVVWCVQVCVCIFVCTRALYSLSTRNRHTHSSGRCNKYLLLIDHSHFCVVYQHSMTLFVLTVLTTQELWIEYGCKSLSNKQRHKHYEWARVYLSIDVYYVEWYACLFTMNKYANSLRDIQLNKLPMVMCIISTSHCTQTTKLYKFEADPVWVSVCIKCAVYFEKCVFSENYSVILYSFSISFIYVIYIEHIFCLFIRNRIRDKCKRPTGMHWLKNINRFHNHQHSR